MGASNSKTKCQNYTPPSPPPPYQEKSCGRSSPAQNKSSTKSGAPAASPPKASPPKRIPQESYLPKATPSTANPSNSSPTNQFIRWDDVPQWKWSTNQCREWLMAVFIDSFNLGLLDSAELARKFEGNGMNLYSKTSSWWKQKFGEDRGYAIFLMLYSVNREPGAIPENIFFNVRSLDNSSKDSMNAEALKKAKERIAKLKK